MAVTKITLEKMKIWKEQPPAKIPVTFEDYLTVQFNPVDLSISKSVSWSNPAPRTTKSGTRLGTNKNKDIPEYEFNGGSAEKLTIKLLFDTYESGTDVTTSVQKFIDLTRIDKDLKRPPICQLMWGKIAVFTGVVTELSRTFNLFLEDGTPVRAEISCGFQEFSELEKTKAQQMKDNAKEHTIQDGERFDTIAAKYYGDFNWDDIAAVNEMTDLRKLKPGTKIKIPPRGQ